MPFDVAISNREARESVGAALASLEGVYSFAATAPVVSVTDGSLDPGVAAVFQVWSNGTLSIVVDPSHTDALAFDFLHEVGHYFDWAVLSPTGSMSTELLPAELRDWANAVGGSQAHRELLRIVNDPQTIHHTLDDGTSVELVEDVQYALYLLQVEELFARSFCQFVAEVSQDPILLGELDRARANHYPEHWQAGDFQPIRDAIEELLGTP